MYQMTSLSLGSIMVNGLKLWCEKIHVGDWMAESLFQ